MQIEIDAWNPGYGTSVEVGEAPAGAGEDGHAAGPGGASTARIDPDPETPAADWGPIPLRADLAPPELVLLVDGVRRIDAQAWITDDDGVTHPGLAASFAAGVVRCDLRRGAAEVAAAQIRRGLFTASRAAQDLPAGRVWYPGRLVAARDPRDLALAVQRDLAALEQVVSTQAREADQNGRDDLLVVDGPLRGRSHLARAVGYVKTHHVEYLPRELTGVVTALGPVQRSPLFRLGTSWDRYTWYLRLPGPGGGPWAGIVRVECSPELTVTQAIRLADRSLVTLPRFASAPYKDPRAPQNLIPIAGLERRLRGLLGDARLLHRSLTIAAQRHRVRGRRTLDLAIPRSEGPA